MNAMSKIIQIKESFFVLLLICFVIFTPGFISADDWHVNSETGSDETGTGSSTNPFKTITHAVSHSDIRSGDTILVYIGDGYNTAIGEVFPIQIPNNVNLQGVPERMIGGRRLPTVQGGGLYDAGFDTDRNVAILASDGSTISNFTFISEDSPGGHLDGTAILCLGTSPTIQDNYFRGDGRSNITTGGDANPVIRDNIFRGDVAWGITVYGDSTPQIEQNDFRGNNGGIDCTNAAQPTIHENTFICNDVAIDLKSGANATITNNTITSYGSFGICFGMASTGMLQDNVIQNCFIGVFLSSSLVTPPDFGGGGRSHGGNRFDNIDWDIQSSCRHPVSARNNIWTHGPCCEFIDSSSIYDDDECPFECGAVDYGFCVYCIAVVSVADILSRLSGATEPVPSPSPYYRNWSYVPVFSQNKNLLHMKDYIFLFDESSDKPITFSKSQLGIKKEDGPVTSALAFQDVKNTRLFAVALPFSDNKDINTGLIILFDAKEKIISRIKGKIKNEKLGLGMIVEKNDLAIASTRRVLRLEYGKVVQEVKLDEKFHSNMNIQVSFIPDQDGDKKKDIQISFVQPIKKKPGREKKVILMGSRSGIITEQQSD